jgi:LmbE family N-acetylglucosaminyl deacetylase
VTKRVAVVFAHPDDDTYGVAAALATHVGDDLEVTAILTTSGEAGLIAEGSGATRETLAAIREDEDRAAWRALGIEPDLHFLRQADGGVADIPRQELAAAYLAILRPANPDVVITFGPEGVTGHADGGVADIPRQELAAAYLAILRPANPDVVITFGPEGVTGHADHIAVGAAATEAFHAARVGGADGFRRLLHSALMRSRLDRFSRLLRERGLDPIDETQPFQPRGTPDEAFGVVVDGTALYERKLAALREHRTQAELQDLPVELWPELLGTEAFVIAWPEREGGAPVLHDVFEDLASS